MPTSTVTLTKDSDKKHSVLFKAGDKEAVLDNLYLRRPFSDGAQEIRVTIEIVR